MVSTIAAVLSGLVVGMGFIIIMASSFGSLPPKSESECSAAQVSLIPFSLQRWVRVYDYIVIGDVLSIKSRIIDESFTSIDPNTGESVFSEVKTRYVIVTIQVEKYLKDSSGKNIAKLTVRDMGSAACYNIGEKAVFFIADVNGNPQVFAYISKFDISEDGMVQSKYFEKKGVTKESRRF
jgi:hypothetical protein